MQMIDVLKRLAELDTDNPNVVKEADVPFGMAKYSSRDPSRPGADEPTEPMYPADKPASRSVRKPKFVIINDPKEQDDARFFGLRQSKNNPKVWAWDGNMEPHHTVIPGEGPKRVDPQEKFASGAWKQWAPKNEQMAESQKVEECGMMGMGAMPAPQNHVPASISITADSGDELSGMLRDIMTLAGRGDHVDHEPLGAEPTAVVDVEPSGDGMGPPEMDGTGSMRAMLDRMNDVEEEGLDNTPADPTEVPGYEVDAELDQGKHNRDQSGPAGAAKGRGQIGNPRATPDSTFESLMAEYKKYISEGRE